MKKYINQLFLVAALLIVASCGDDDPCMDLNCGSGTCEDGTCVCPEGYEGASCGTLEIAKYFGQFAVTNFECVDSSTLGTETVTIEAQSNGEPFEVVVTIKGFAFEEDLVGTLKNESLDVSFTSVEGTITITGIFKDDNSFTGEYIVNNDVVCIFKLEKN